MLRMMGLRDHPGSQKTNTSSISKTRCLYFHRLWECLSTVLDILLCAMLHPIQEDTWSHPGSLCIISGINSTGPLYSFHRHNLNHKMLVFLVLVINWHILLGWIHHRSLSPFSTTECYKKKDVSYDYSFPYHLFSIFICLHSSLQHVGTFIKTTYRYQLDKEGFLSRLILGSLTGSKTLT